MLRRELAIVLRSPLTWLQAALSALLVGHGFVLAVDLYSAASRSATANTLAAREMDPLLGVVRPTLGGLYLALSLLGPIAASRAVAIEKERRTWNARLLHTGSPLRVLASKTVASLVGVGLQLAAPAVLLVAWRAAGGHLAFPETATAFLAYALYLALVTSIAIAAAAWTRSLAQAATAGLLVIAASWAVDASEGFAALAWMGRALDWSVTTHLNPLERGTLALGPGLWMATVALGGFGLAWVGAREDLPLPRRGALAVAVALATGLGGAAAHATRRAFDLTEDRRGSLPAAVAAGLRALPGPLGFEVWLDRDDARRRQLEIDVVAKLRLARPDFEVATPTDQREAPAEGERDPSYGRIIVRSGAAQRQTYSTSRRELVTLLFEAQGRPVPDWSQVDYPGYPDVIEGPARTMLGALAYGGVPVGLFAMGLVAARNRRRTT